MWTLFIQAHIGAGRDDNWCLLNHGEKVLEWWWENTLYFMFRSIVWETAGQVTSQEEVLVELQWTGVISAQLGCTCWYTRAKGVSFGLYPATRLGNFLFSSWMRGVWGCPGPQKGSAGPRKTRSPGWASAGAVLAAVGSKGTQRQVGAPFFSFSTSQVGADTSAALCSVFSPRINMMPATSQSSQWQPQEQGQPLIISAHSLARQSCVFWLHAFVVFISLILKV